MYKQVKVRFVTFVSKKV